MNKAIGLWKGGMAFLKFVRDPNRLDEVFSFADEVAKNPQFSQPLIDFYKKDPVGEAAYTNKPRIGNLDLDYLASFPEGSLGREFAEHMRRNNLNPAALPVRKAETDAEYSIAHAYETHDVWHVVTGFATDVPGELGLQAFYLAQAPAQVSSLLLVGGLANGFLYQQADVDARMHEIARGWFLGKKAKSLFGHDWKAMWSIPLAEVRQRLDIQIEEMDAFLAPRMSAPAQAAA